MVALGEEGSGTPSEAPMASCVPLSFKLTEVPLLLCVVPLSTCVSVDSALGGLRNGSRDAKGILWIAHPVQVPL